MIRNFERRLIGITFVFLPLLFAGCQGTNGTKQVEFLENKSPESFVIKNAGSRRLPSAVGDDCDAIWEFGTVRKNLPDINESRWFPEETKYLVSPTGVTEEIQLPGPSPSFKSLYSGEADGDNRYLVYAHTPQTKTVNQTQWTLTSWNKPTKTMRIIAANDLGPEPDISADNGYIAYTDLVNAKSQNSTLGIFLARGDMSTKPKLIEADSGAVSLSWPYAFVLKRTSTPKNDGSYLFSIDRLDIKSGSRLRIDSGTMGRASFAAGSRYLFIGKPTGEILITDLDGNHVLNFSVPNAFSVLMVDDLENGFVFRVMGTERELGYSAMLVETNSGWKMVTLSRVNDKFQMTPENIYGHQNCVYWFDSRTATPSPDAPKGDTWYRRIHHFGTISEILKLAVEMKVTK